MDVIWRDLCDELGLKYEFIGEASKDTDFDAAWNAA